MCECADEEIPTTESVDENQYLVIQLQAPALCDSLPTGGCREGFSKPVPSYEAQSNDNPKAPPQSCHTEAQARPEVPRREVRPKPVIPYEAQYNDDQKAASPIHDANAIDKKIEYLSYLARRHPELLTPEENALLPKLEKMKARIFDD